MIGSLVLLLLGGGVWLWGLTPRDFSPETLRDFSVADMAALALLTLLAGLLAWWLFIVPIWAAIRLLGTRIQPGDIALPDVMAARAQRDDERAEVPAGSRSAAATRYVALAWALGLASAVVVLWLFANVDKLIALILEFAAIYAVTMLWRRSRKLAALDAQEVLKRDPRSPVLYLRTFVDDSELMQTEWDMVLKTGAGSSARANTGKEESALARAWRRYSIGWLSTSGRIEEGIAPEFKSIGPFVGIGAPNEPLPELGAARAYFTSETWQDAIVKWVDMARLIIKVAGSTKWIRWELDTIIDRGALSKLVILMPPGAPRARVGRWQNLMGELQSTPWGPALSSVDPVNLGCAAVSGRWQGLDRHRQKRPLDRLSAGGAADAVSTARCSLTLKLDFTLARCARQPTPLRPEAGTRGLIMIPRYTGPRTGILRAFTTSFALNAFDFRMPRRAVTCSSGPSRELAVIGPPDHLPRGERLVGKSALALDRPHLRHPDRDPARRPDDRAPGRMKIA